MKHTISYSVILLSASLLLGTSCSKMLQFDSETSVTNDFLYSTPEGLQRAIAGLYVYERNNIVDDSPTPKEPDGTSIVYNLQMLDYCTDIIFFRAGNGASLARLATMSPDQEFVEKFWQFYYQVIGKANEIIAAAENLGLDNPNTHRAWAEAKVFRARAYFYLYQRYERLYVNTIPTDITNLDREFTASEKDEIFTLIKGDLNDAIAVLDWQLPMVGKDYMYGRFTKAVAKHVRAQVAMWEEDWSEAIRQCEDIFTEGIAYYDMMPTLQDVFASENLRSKEVLFAYQFSKNVGGGGKVSGSNIVGHSVASYTTARFMKIEGCIAEAAQGGFGWGRNYPNLYLLGLYEASDTRRTTMYTDNYIYNDPTKTATYGNVIPSSATDGYAEQLHPMSRKQADYWTNQDQPDRKTSFKDLMVYRLAETYLMASEAYFHKEGGSSTKALEYFNKTYARAGNTARTEPLTLDVLLDEYARELNFEGVRWPLLKRLGKLGERVRLHSGESRTENPNLNEDYIDARWNFVDGKHEIWPIPSNQLLLMGDSFGQNDAWK